MRGQRVVEINPHIAAYALVAQVVNAYLKELPGSPFGIFISDENKEVVKDLEKSHRVLRGTAGPLHLSQVIEKGFFIDSRKSLLLQLADLCAYCLRMKEELAAQLPVKPLNATVGGAAYAPGKRSPPRRDRLAPG